MPSFLFIRSAALAVCALSLTACSSSSDSSTIADSTPDAGKDSSTSPPDASTFTCEEGSALDLDGIYATFAKMSLTFVSHPGGAVTVCPVDQTSEGTFLALMRIKHEAGSNQLASLEAYVCTLTLPEISATVGDCPTDNVVVAGLRFPDTLVKALPTTPVAVTSGTLASLQPGTAFDVGRMTFVIGTRKTGDLMPGWQSDQSGCGMNDTSPGRGPTCETTCVNDCAACVDDDKDGWDAVTVHVCGFSTEDKKMQVECNSSEPSIAGATIQGRAILDLQVDPLFEGQAGSSCGLEGTFDAQIRYNVVGADLYLGGTPISVTAAIASLPDYKVNSSHSPFRMMRIDGKHGAPDWSPDFSDPVQTCQRLIERQNEIK